MDPSYWLRIDSGDRRGERVSIPAAGLVLGRSGEADVVLDDRSVSNRHARLEVGRDGVRVQDLGSRNGTRVGSERLHGDHLLAHGDRLRFGHVTCTFQDGALAQTADSGDDLHHLEPAELPPPRRIGPRVGIAVVLVLLTAFVVRSLVPRWSGTNEGTAGTRAPEPVEGDLLAAGSFEAEHALAPWVQAESRPFVPGRPFTRSGEIGIGAGLTADERVELRSAPVRVRAGVTLEARSFVRLDPGVGASQAIVLEHSAGDRPPLVLHGARSRGSSGESAAPAEGRFAPLVSVARVLPGYDAARFALFAAADVAGSLALDDVSLAPVIGGVGGVGVAGRVFEEFELLLQGEPAVEAVLLHIERPLVLALSLAPTARAPGGPPTLTETPFDVEVTDVGFELVFAETGTLSLVLDDALAAEGLATRGSQGFRSRTFEFEADDVIDLVAGASPRLLRLGFGAGTTLRSRPLSGSGVAVTASPVARLTLQLAFRDERARAGDLAVRARRAEQESTPADALAVWAELLSDFPFDRALVAEAVETRARLVEVGLAEVAELRRNFERARFFQLADIYRRGRMIAEDLLARYAGSEVAAELEVLLAEIDAAFVASVDVERELEADRLRRVAAILAREGAQELAAHVRDEVAGDGSGER